MLKNRKIFFFLSVILLLGDLFFTGISIFVAHHSFQLSLKEIGKKQQSAYELAFSMESDNLLKMATFIAADEKNQQILFNVYRTTLEQGESSSLVNSMRTLLLTNLAPTWELIQHDVDTLQFYLTTPRDSLVYLRVHQPNSFGDKVGVAHRMVQDVNRYQQPRIGFVSHGASSELHSVVPVFVYDSGRKKRIYIGALEVGIGFARVAQLIEEHLNSGIAILRTTVSPGGTVEQTQEVIPSCGCVLETSSRVQEIKSILQMNKLSFDRGSINTISTWSVASQGRYFALTQFPLYDTAPSHAALRIKTYPPVGKMLIWSALTAEINTYYQGIQMIAIYAVVGYLVLETLLYGSLRFIHQDITKTITAYVLDLRKSEERLESTGKIAKIGHWELDLATWEVKWYGQTVEILGIHPLCSPSLDAIAVVMHPDDWHSFIQQIRSSSIIQMDYGAEYRIIHHDGEHYIYSHMRTECDPTKEPVRLLGIIQEISASKQNEIALRASEARIRVLAEDLAAKNRLLEIISHTQSKFIQQSDPMAIFHSLLQDIAALTGSQLGFMSGVIYHDGVAHLRYYSLFGVAWDNEYFRQLYENIRLNGGFLTVESNSLPGQVANQGKVILLNHLDSSRIKMIPGHPGIENFLGIPVLYGKKIVGEIGLANRSGGYDEGILAYIQPIVDVCGQLIAARREQEGRALIEQALVDAEQRYRTLFELSPDGIVVIVPESGQVVDFNFAALEPLGYTAEEFRHLNISEYEVADYREKTVEGIIKSHFEGADRFETVFRTKAGALRSIDVIVQWIEIQGASYCLNVWRDITEQKQTESQLRAILDNFPFFVWLKDTEGKILASNQPLANFASVLSPLDLVGKNDFDIWPSDLAEKYGQDDHEVLMSGEPRNAEEAFYDEGKPVWIETYRSPVKTEEGTILGTVGFSRDITVRKQLEQKLKFFEALTECSGDPIYAISPAEGFRMVYCNNAAIQHFKLPRESVLQLTVPEWDKQFSLENLPALWESVRQAGSISFETTHNVAGGVTIPVEVTANYLSFDDQEYAVGYFHDIIHRKQTEEALKKAKEDAEIANHAKSNFLATMSHEIRTPLNAIVGMGYLLSQTSLSQQQSTYLHDLKNASKTLLNLINDILDFSKIEAGKMTLESTPFRFDEMWDNLRSIASSCVREKPVQFVFNIDKRIPEGLKGDSLKLAQVLTNLISNAAKFTKQGTVTVSCQLAGLTDSQAQISFMIQDSGIGMTPEQIGRLFQVFSQGDSSTTRQYGGTGLGLAISKRLVNLMGGDLQVVSTYGQGSCFDFTLNLTRLSSKEEGIVRERILVEKTTPEPLAGIKILLVEDNLVNQKLAKNILERFGASVTLAAHGLEAVAKVKEGNQSFDAILMDIQMPYMDGYAATQMIREDARFQSLPIIAMTAHAFDEERERCLDVGMNDHIAKPIDVKVLLSILTYWKRKYFPNVFDTPPS